jgi:uncharacterized membrane protein YoaK (UPF0700 family)
MSGNSVRLGVELGSGDLTAAIRYALVIPVFVVGVALGVVLVELGRRRGFRTPAAAALALEGGLLLVFMVAGSALRHGSMAASTAAGYDLLITLPVLAMGIQTAALRRVAGRTVRTTYITGMLTHFAEDGVRYLLDRRRKRWTGCC